ncbi:MAG: BolA/IbaG family iron-sulfur metabolism protein [Oceanicoccus sp.]
MSVQTEISTKLQSAFSPSFLDVINESHMHNVPPNSETHFNVVLVSDVFEGKRSVARHQMIYKLLAEEIDGPVHALALHTHTKAEWLARGSSVPASPDCLGGGE